MVDSFLFFYSAFQVFRADGVPELEGQYGVLVALLEVAEGELDDGVDVVGQQVVAVLSELKQDFVDLVAAALDLEQAEHDLHGLVAELRGLEYFSQEGDAVAQGLQGDLYNDCFRSLV